MIRDKRAKFQIYENIFIIADLVECFDELGVRMC